MISFNYENVADNLSLDRIKIIFFQHDKSTYMYLCVTFGDLSNALKNTRLNIERVRDSFCV